MQKANTNLIKDLKKQKRENSYLLFLDNIKIIKDALLKGIKPLYIFVEKEKSYLFKDYDNILYIVERKVIEQLSDTKTPQGVVCIAEYIPHIVEKPNTNFLVIDGLQDPGNVGSLIRTACACGFNYVYLIESVKVTNSKLIRSSVGTIFDVKIVELTREKFVEYAKQWKLNLLKADMKGDSIFNYTNNDLVGVVIGNEGQGVSNEISQLCKISVSIPMKNNVESLNASVSGSIIMYELSKNNFN